MPSPVSPSAEIPLESYPDGSFASPMLEFAPDGRTLYMRQPVVEMSWGQWAMWYGPDIAAVALLVAMFVALAVTRRVVRSPREWGKVYCRRCNYKLTPPLVTRDNSGKVVRQEGVRCPECGAELARVHPAIGRPAMVRLWPVWLAIPAMVLSAAALVFTLQRFAPGKAYGAWPVRGTEQLLGRFAVQKKPWWERSFPEANRITRWSVPDGKRVGKPWMVDTHGYYNGRLSTDGSVYLNVVMTKPGWDLQLVSIDTATGARHSVDLSPVGSGADLIGFSRDGKSVFVQASRNRPTSTRGNGTWMCDVSLRVFDIRTLEATEIVSVERAPNPGPGGWEWPYLRFVVDDSAEAVRWALMVGRSDATRKPTQAEVEYFDGMERKKWDIPPPAAAMGWYEPKLLNGGATLEVNFYGTPLPPATLIDLKTGATSSAASSMSSTRNYGASANGKWRLAPGATNLDVTETQGGRVRATLSVATVAGSGGGAVSNDGRYVACVTWDTAAWAKGKPPRPTVKVWDVGEEGNRTNGTDGTNGTDEAEQKR